MSKEYDWEFRPASYYFEDDWKGEILSQVDGKIRREFAARTLADLEIETYEEFVGAMIDGSIDTAMFRPQTGAEKQALGAIDPALMGGEYLPKFAPREVEIARVSLESTLADCISIRAGFADGEYRYRIVDEYGSEFDFEPETSATPLTFRQLVNLINWAELTDTDFVLGLHDSYLELNYYPGRDPQELSTFVTVSSFFYPQLEDYFAERSAAWVNKKLGGEGV